MRAILSALVFSVGIIATSYSEDSGPDDATAAILHMHELDRQAHLKGDAADIESRLDAQIVVVSEGNITTETKEAMYERLVEGFQKTEYSAWEDINRPVIKVSQDGTMAWAAFNVQSQYVEKQPGAKPRAVNAAISWLSTYDNRAGHWVMTGAATTYPSESQ